MNLGKARFDRHYIGVRLRVSRNLLPNGKVDTMRTVLLDTQWHPTALTVRNVPTGHLADLAVARFEKEQRAARRRQRKGMKSEGITVLSRRQQIERTLSKCSRDQQDRLIAAAIAAY